ncbi:MAG: ATP-binding cassette domain-containing protein [Lachnospiraceae bacterium]|nr:ATP-binding cassette domain-containing protein [Lachnospiraceae bacterium]
MQKTRIRLDNISKSYYSETAVTQALRKINLSFSEGEFVAITGESGSGKSTLLNIIGGMDSFDDGEMYIDGEPTFQYDDQDWEDYRQKKIGYVFQDYSLIGHYSVLANVVSALMIMGYERKEARKVAKEYLAQVGLSDYIRHRANELSSGQKQRLSIARALAKNTGIIVADEPTGNLDSETGEQIIRLLKELSKTRLVIMVTHNFEQAQDYVTRKIRIHDGELISDVQMNQEAVGEVTSASGDVQVVTTGTVDANISGFKGWFERFRKQSKLALFFARKNCLTLPGRSLLFTMFLLVVSVVSFLFIGQLYMNADDIFTKEYSQKGFYKANATRLVVKKEDGTTFTDEDLQAVSDVNNVLVVDSCDFANDINYYIEEDRDYEYLYGRRIRGEGESKVVSFLNESHFLMSTDCIDESDLTAGRLPETRNEIVLYAEDSSVIGEERLCYFTAANIWDVSEYYQTNLVVTGILKNPTEQVYFSKEFCNMLSMNMDSGVYRLYYNYDYTKEDYKQKPEVVPVVADDLKGNLVRVSHKFEVPTVGYVTFHFQDRDEEGNLEEEAIELDVRVLPETNSSTTDFMEVSEEFFYTYYSKEVKQISVYITSYAKTDEVIKALADKGYLAMSTYRTSVTEYVESLVSERLIIIAISAGVLVVLAFAQILILRSLMKIRIKDFFVLKFIGMKLQVIKKISYFEFGIYSGIAMVITVIAMWVLRYSGVDMIRDMMWYYEFGAYAFFVLYNLVLSALTVAAFNHLLKGRLNA